MKRSLAALMSLLAVTSALGGCYLGKSSGRKVVAYGINGSLIAVGVGGIAHAQGQSDDAQLASNMMLVPVFAGLLGIAINAMTDTVDEPAGARHKPAPLANVDEALR